MARPKPQRLRDLAGRYADFLGWPESRVLAECTARDVLGWAERQAPPPRYKTTAAQDVATMQMVGAVLKRNAEIIEEAKRRRGHTGQSDTQLRRSQ